jgi:ADP-ribose pyrophosphatase YjhB (NUDIX family)
MKMMNTHRFVAMNATYRVAGIALHENHILLKRWGSTWSLLESLVRPHEDAREVLRRTMSRELGTNVRAGRMLGVLEDTLDAGRSPSRTMTFCYQVTFDPPVLMLYPRGTPIICSVHHENVVFEWTPLARLEQLGLLPPRLLEQLSYLPTQEQLVADFVSI